MLCPQCRSERCRRSKRHGIQDRLIGLSKVRPWRCQTCGLRFYAWSVAFPFLYAVHCSRCGNFDLQRISSRHIEGWHARFFRWARVPAYRCSPCRERFFSIRPYRPIRSIEAEMGIPAGPQAVSR